MMGTSPDLDDDTPVDKRVHWNRFEDILICMFVLVCIYA
jgi:hypothetical protein